MNRNNKSNTEKIIQNYSSEPPHVLGNLRRLLTSGALANTGKLLIYPVDQGFEHGPDQSFAINPDSYSPHYHAKLAVDAGFSAYAAPAGMISAISQEYAGVIPLILKINNGNTLSSTLNKKYTQSRTSSVQNALRLGCSGVGITIYPGSEYYESMLEMAAETIEEARNYGLFTVIWSYPRHHTMSKSDETSANIVSYAAHMAASLDAHIIKVKIPTQITNSQANMNANNAQTDFNTSSTEALIQNVMRATLNSKKLVLFSGGNHKKDSELLQEVAAVHNGGGSGSIIGRNVFQRPYDEAVALIKQIIQIYKR